MPERTLVKRKFVLELLRQLRHDQETGAPISTTKLLVALTAALEYLVDQLPDGHA